MRLMIEALYQALEDLGADGVQPPGGPPIEIADIKTSALMQRTPGVLQFEADARVLVGALLGRPAFRDAEGKLQALPDAWEWGVDYDGDGVMMCGGYIVTHRGGLYWVEPGRNDGRPVPAVRFRTAPEAWAVVDAYVRGAK